MKVTIVPIVIGAFGTISKGLLKGLEDLEVGDRVETIQTTQIPQSSSIIETSLSDYLVSYPGHSLGGVLTHLQ